MSVPECIKQMRSLMRLSLEHNPLDVKILEQIRKEGALSLIEKEASIISKECMFFFGGKRGLSYEYLKYWRVSFVRIGAYGRYLKFNI